MPNVIDLGAAERLIRESLQRGIVYWAEAVTEDAKELAPIRRSRKLNDRTGRFEEEHAEDFAAIRKSRRRTAQVPVPVELVPTEQGSKTFTSRAAFSHMGQFTAKELAAVRATKTKRGLQRLFTARPLSPQGIGKIRREDIRRLGGLREDKELGFVTGGFLKEHIAPTAPEWEGRRIKALVVSGAKYSKPLEYGHQAVVFGHRTGKHVRARPFMRPVIAKYRSAGSAEVRDLFPHIGG